MTKQTWLFPAGEVISSSIIFCEKEYCGRVSWSWRKIITKEREKKSVMIKLVNRPLKNDFLSFFLSFLHSFFLSFFLPSFLSFFLSFFLLLLLLLLSQFNISLKPRWGLVTDIYEGTLDPGKKRNKMTSKKKIHFLSCNFNTNEFGQRKINIFRKIKQNFLHFKNSRNTETVLKVGRFVTNWRPVIYTLEDRKRKL